MTEVDELMRFGHPDDRERRLLRSVPELDGLALVAGALRVAADGTAASPMIGAGPVYLARATLVGVALGRMGAGEHADLMFEDVAVDSETTLARVTTFPGCSPRLRLWTTGAGRDEAARILSAIFDEAEVDAAIAGVGSTRGAAFHPAVATAAGPGGPPLGPRRVRLLLVDVDPREFEGEAPDECAARGEGHEFGPHGPDEDEGAEQCRYCGAPRGSGATEIVTYAIGIGRIGT